jgi:hypothetical protein
MFTGAFSANIKGAQRSPEPALPWWVSELDSTV